MHPGLADAAAAAWSLVSFAVTIEEGPCESPRNHSATTAMAVGCWGLR